MALAEKGWEPPWRQGGAARAPESVENYVMATLSARQTGSPDSPRSHFDVDSAGPALNK